MPKRSRKPKKPPSDPNRAAFAVIKHLEESEKNPAAVALGRLGGLRGGKARADSLTAEERSEIAKAAAEARWRNKK